MRFDASSRQLSNICDRTSLEASRASSVSQGSSAV